MGPTFGINLSSFDNSRTDAFDHSVHPCLGTRGSNHRIGCSVWIPVTSKESGRPGTVAQRTDYCSSHRQRLKLRYLETGLLARQICNRVVEDSVSESSVTPYNELKELGQ